MEHSQSTGAGLLLAGRYRLSETIGSGGMGKVWRAHDEVLHRVVAVKELTAGRYVSEADRIVLHARTQKEARAAARISHPGVVTVHDVLEHDARPWIVMQYVDGPSLADAAKESGRIPAAEAARIGLHVLRALGAAHAAGVLHRDVKPANVLLNRDGRVLITDFGIAAIEGDSTITRTGEIVGSIDYLAPERVRGADPGPASDLWSLGATLYTAVEGESPSRRSSPLASMQAVVGEEPRHPEWAGPLGPVIMALLRKDPAERPSAAEAEQMLAEAMGERRAAPRTPQVPAQRTTERHTRPVTTQLPTPTPPAPEPVPSPGPGTGSGTGTTAQAAPPRAAAAGCAGPRSSWCSLRLSVSARDLPPWSTRAATTMAERVRATRRPPSPALPRPSRALPRPCRPAGTARTIRKASACSYRTAGRARRTATRSTTRPTTASTASGSAVTIRPNSRIRIRTCWTWRGVWRNGFPSTSG